MAFKKIRKEDSFAQWFIDTQGIDRFTNLIDHEKNAELKIDIWHISKRSSVQIWFKCENKDYHKYCLTADKYFKGVRCKYCGRTKYVHPLDSFGQLLIDQYGNEFLKKIWSDKNEKSPFKYTIGSEQKAFFNCCECGEYMSYSQIKNYIASKKMCLQCLGKVSNLHLKVLGYLKELKRPFNTEYDCSITPINPVTKYPLPYDIEDINGKLIIEVHGRQHYDKCGDNSKWLHGLTSIEYLAKRKKYDEFKKSFALANGFFYLEIPYWSEKNDEYKILIDTKLKEIQNTPTTTENE